MSDFPRNYVVPTHINTLSRQGAGNALRLSGAPASVSNASWVDNLACYQQLYLPWPYNVRRVFWGNGPSPAGNIDVGIYTPGGTRIWSAGSTAMVGASVPQYVAPSPDLLLTPGPYVLGFAYHSTGGFSEMALSMTTGKTVCIYAQTSAFPLPATAVFSQWTFGIMPIVGITNTDSGF